MRGPSKSEATQDKKSRTGKSKDRISKKDGAGVHVALIFDCNDSQSSLRYLLTWDDGVVIILRLVCDFRLRCKS